MEIRIDNLTGPNIASFLEEHIREMKAVSPPESKHALDLEELKKPEITVWTVWENNGQLLGCGAIKELDSEHAEVKSMRTSLLHRRKGIAKILLQHILCEAKLRGYQRLSLETGSMPFFEPARTLYRTHGFKECMPFATYKADPNSVFMTRKL